MDLLVTDNITRTLLSVLKPAFSEARQARLAVAFVKYSGLALLQDSLEKCLRNGGEVEFLVGLDFRTTEPVVLRRLHQLSSGGLRVKCYCFSDPSMVDTAVYHPKLYLLTTEEKAFISIGSSNLTQGGLQDNVEVNAVITADIGAEVVSDIYALYNILKFQQSRFEPDLEYIEIYEQAYERVVKRSATAFREERTRKLIRTLRDKEQALPRPRPVEADLFGWQALVYGKLPERPFRTRDMYVYEEEFRKLYPNNRNIRAKIRQILQQLRDLGLLQNPRRDSWGEL